MADSMKVYKAELRDLESLLRKKLGDDLVVVKYTTESLLPPGENYGSTILKVDAVIKRKSDAKEEDLHLVAKLLPATEMYRIMFDAAVTFKKEAFIYEELVPAYRKLEREFGIKDDELIDILAEFFGVRHSSLPVTDAHNDTVMLLRNLKMHEGYYLADRRQGLDLSHAKIAITALARFHALGVALKTHKPEYFEIVKNRAKCINIKLEDFQDMVMYFIQMVQADPVLSKHFDAIYYIFTELMPKSMTEIPEEPWSTIIHSDFWVNNFMFRKDPETGEVTDIKFVDFQNFLFVSPLREMVFFLMTNLNREVMENNFDELTDRYYDTFIATLKKLKCNVEVFSRDKFDARLKIDAFKEFGHCPFLLKIVTADKEESKSGDVQTVIQTQTLNPLFIEKLHRCVHKYEEKGWLEYTKPN